MPYAFKIAALFFFFWDFVAKAIGQPSDLALTVGLIFIMLDAIEHAKG